MNDEVLKERSEKCHELALQYDWLYQSYNPDTYQLDFIKGDERITIYLSKMTVGTVVIHPKQGRTQLFRKGVGYKLLEQLFKNPRYHSDRGYKTKKEKSKWQN